MKMKLNMKIKLNKCINTINNNAELPEKWTAEIK